MNSPAHPLPDGVPGQLIEVDGYLWRVLDSGPPHAMAVILEAGASGTLDSFNLVRRLLPEELRVISYDRPGLGWSQPEPTGDRRPIATAQRLRHLLDALDVQRPAILCGHSLGGLYCRAFASLYPQRTRALVLVDPSHEHMMRDLSPALRAATRAQTRLMTAGMRTLARASRVGGRQIAAAMTPRTLLERLDLGTAATTALVRSYTRPQTLRAVAAELAQVEASCAQMQVLASLPASLAVTVLSAGQGREPGSAGMAGFLNSLHARLATQTRNAAHQIIADSGHLMPWDNPAAIADAITEHA